MFQSSRRIHLGLMIRRAKQAIRAGNPISLDTYAQLDAAGIDINELERTTRNG